MGALQDAPPCTNDTALEVYFNSKKTKEALHVKEDISWTRFLEDDKRVPVSPLPKSKVKSPSRSPGKRRSRKKSKEENTTLVIYAERAKGAELGVEANTYSRVV